MVYLPGNYLESAGKWIVLDPTAGKLIDVYAVGIADVHRILQQNSVTVTDIRDVVMFDTLHLWTVEKQLGS